MKFGSFFLGLICNSLLHNTTRIMERAANAQALSHEKDYNPSELSSDETSEGQSGVDCARSAEGNLWFLASVRVIQTFSPRLRLSAQSAL